MALFLSIIRKFLGREINPLQINESRSLSSTYQFLADCQIPRLGEIYENYFGPKSNGIVVEIGANNALAVSNSIGLLRAGWKGVLVEALPRLAKEAGSNLEKYPNAKIVNIAIGAPGEKELVIHDAGLLSTARKDLMDEYKKIAWAQDHLSNETQIVPVITLDELLVRHDIPPFFEVLIIDVEGYENSVLAGFTLNTFRPQMVVIELSDNHRDLFVLRKEHSGIHLSFLLQQYVPVFKDHINTIYVDKSLYLSRVGIGK